MKRHGAFKPKFMGVIPVTPAFFVQNRWSLPKKPTRSVPHANLVATTPFEGKEDPEKLAA